jgi:4-amino-4-deoxy-L-arabinose transferase-like glycosyltransferase
MFRQPHNPFAVKVLMLVCLVHAILLFVAIPKLSSRLRHSYNQEIYTDGYDQLAWNLAEGRGYRMYADTSETMMREPGYPILLAGIFAAFGRNFAIVTLANMLMAFAISVVLLRLSGEIIGDPVIALLPPLIFLLHPAILIAESRGGIEILYALFLALFMSMLHAAIKTGRSMRYIACGGILGLTLLVRSVPLLFPILLLFYFLVFDEPMNQSAPAKFRNITFMIVAMLLVLSPWIIRNYLLAGKFVPTASVLGVSAQAGEYVFTHGTGQEDRFQLDGQAAQERNALARRLGYPFKEGYYQCFYSSKDELEFSSYLFHRVASDYRSKPKLFARFVVSNLGAFWTGGKTASAERMNKILQIPLLALGLIGLMIFWREGRLKVVAPLVLLIGYSMAISAPILAQARYSVPVVPYVAILASIPLLKLRGVEGIPAWHKAA